MPTSAPGSSRRRHRGCGFTLFELLLVVAIIAIATGGVGLSLRTTEANRLEREGERLAALLESARARSRATGVPVRWMAREGGFRFEGLAGASAGLQAWQLDGLAVDAPVAVTLGPEPILEPVAIALIRGEHRVRVASDGLRPFALATSDAADAAARAAP